MTPGASADADAALALSRGIVLAKLERCDDGVAPAADKGSDENSVDDDSDDDDDDDDASCDNDEPSDIDDVNDATDVVDTTMRSLSGISA